MARYRVRRPFPAAVPMRTGQIFEDPNWRLLPKLIKQGYVEEIVEEIVEGRVTEALPIEAPEEASASVIDEIAAEPVKAPQKKKATSKKTA